MVSPVTEVQSSSNMQNKSNWIRLSSRFVLLLVSIFIYLNDNIYDGMRFIDSDQLPSPYSLSFLDRYREINKNVIAENVLLPRAREQLNQNDYIRAKQAWSYFERNINPATGLVNLQHGKPVTSSWDIASGMSASHAALQLGIINQATFDKYLQLLLSSLLSIDLVNNEVPNRYYNTATGRMVGYSNKEAAVGYSPIDIGRLLTWLYIYKQRYPAFAGDLDKIALRFNYCNLIDGGELFGGQVDRSGRVRVVQQGRLGYEEYAAKGFYLWGFDTGIAAKHEPLEMVRVAGQRIPIDQRDVVNPLEKSFVATDAYLLDGIEFGWDLPQDNYTPPHVFSDAFSYKTSASIYHAQRLRFESSGILTARSEIQLPQPPYFVYNTIYANGQPWLTIDDFGRELDDFSAIATGAVFSLWALWDTPYTDLLHSRLANIYKEGIGFYEGVYESGALIDSYTANTNARVLAATARIGFGAPKIDAEHTGLWEFALTNALNKKVNPNCYPIERVCERDCDQIASFNTNGIKNRRLRELQEKLIKLETTRDEVLKPFEIVQ